jgi:hypothetical protein
MYLFPKLFKTVTSETWRFICLGGYGWRGQKKWQRVRKLFWFVWVNNGEKFWDWSNMFEKVH